MKYSKYLLCFLLSFGLLISCSEDTDLIPQLNLESNFISDVSYGEHSDQVFDLYLPANRTFDTKMMILIHGGGWRTGDTEDLAGFEDFIIERHPDLAVVNINYRLTDSNNPPLPMQIDDITSVVDFLRENQQEFQIGTELGFLGVSAGAHLSLMWSYVYDKNDQVKMVCSIVGPTNFADEAYINSGNQELTDLFSSFGETIDELKNASPLYKVKSTSPPTILLYGAKDPLIPNSQGIDLDNKLEELNVEHEFTLYPNAGHGWTWRRPIRYHVKVGGVCSKKFIELIQSNRS